MEEIRPYSGYILIIEDSEINRVSLERLLLRAGWEVNSAASGEEALRMMSSRFPDMVILDVMLPGMDGFETCRAMRELPEGRDLPVLFMTGLADTENKVRGFEAGGTDYIPKPFAEEELLSRIEAQFHILSLRRALTLEIKAKDEALIELEAFSHTVAHDLKNPLSAMISLAEELRSGGKEPEIAETLVEAGRQCYRIIDDILVLSSVRGERVNPVQVDIQACLEEVMNTLRWLYREHGATVEMPDSLPPALGRHSWVAQVWMNFLTNAVRYGGKPPHIRIGSDVGEGVHRYWVEDNGSGVPDTEKARIFSPFERLDDLSLTGTGLGLSIVRRILERLDGGYGVIDADRGGARFYFELPAVS